MKYSINRSEIFAFLVGRKFDVGILFGVVLLGIVLDFGVAEIFFLAVFVWSILGPIQSKWLAFFSGCFFFATPVLLLLDFEKYAEKSSIYAYYLLIIMIVRVIAEMKAEKK